MQRLPKLAVTCLVTAVALWGTPISAKNVNCDIPQQNLQKAINGAEVGEEITVSGTCSNGPFFIRREVSLVGPATLQAPAGFAVLEIRGGTASLDTLTIDATDNAIGIVVEGATVRMSGVIVGNAVNEGMRLMGTSKNGPFGMMLGV